MFSQNGNFKPLRILISSNAPHASTGYGVQAKGLAYGLKAMGHEVAIHAWYGLQGGVINAGGILMYPRLQIGRASCRERG